MKWNILNLKYCDPQKHSTLLAVVSSVDTFLLISSTIIENTVSICWRFQYETLITFFVSVKKMEDIEGYQSQMKRFLHWYKTQSCLRSTLKVR